MLLPETSPREDHAREDRARSGLVGSALDLLGFASDLPHRLPRVVSAFERGLGAVGISGPEQLRARLEEDPSLRTELERPLRRTATRFVRDHETFRRLGLEIVPELSLRAHEHGRDRVEAWSAGCGSGEEVYSLALMAWLGNRGRRPDPPLHILGTDVDSGLVEVARAATYPRQQSRSLPPELHGRAFQSEGKNVRVKDALREGTRFEVQDLRHEAPRERFDLVLWRNIPFQDFSAGVQQSLLTRLHAVTRPGSWVVVGSHESLPTSPWLSVAAPGFYRRR